MVLIPIMASRLMLSLKKAVVDSKLSWSPSVMADLGQGRPVGGIRFESGVPGGLDGVPGISISPNEEGVELQSLDSITLVSRDAPTSNVGMISSSDPPPWSCWY